MGYDSSQLHRLQHTGLSCPSPSPRVYPNSCPLRRWCHPAISSSVVPFSSCLRSFPASGSFPVSRLFPSGGQSIGVSASALVLPMNIQGFWLNLAKFQGNLALTGSISLQSKGFSRVFFSTTIWKYRFFSLLSCLWSNSHICTRLLEKP